MSWSQLQTWLGLGAGPWPPDHYALLQINRGAIDPSVVEMRVLERMDRLRAHQLLQPDLVTEGMNRLAQALICLSDPLARAAYDTELNGGLPENFLSLEAPAPVARPAPIPPLPTPRVEVEEFRPSTVVVAEPLFDDEVFSADAAEAAETNAADLPDRTQIIELTFGPGLEPPPLQPGTDARVVAWDAAPGAPIELPYEFLPAEKPAAPMVVEAVPLTLPVVQTAAAAPASRRWIYKRLAILRKVLRHWNNLRPVAANPDEFLDRPASLIPFLESVHDLRPLLPEIAGVLGTPGDPGGLVAAMLRQPFVVDAFRELLPDQRMAVAVDWKRGLFEIEREYRRLRDLSAAGLRPSHPKPSRIIHWLRQTPELIPAALALVAILLALLRGGH